MVIISTSAVLVSIQAVSPVSGVDGATGTASGAAGVVCASTGSASISTGRAAKAQPAAPAASISADDVVATLEKLHGLVGKGILSQAEFDAKKAELLQKLS